MDIKAIFEGNLKVVTESQINTITVNETQHLQGIINIARSIEPNFEITENINKILLLFLSYFTGNPNFAKMFQDITDAIGSLEKSARIDKLFDLNTWQNSIIEKESREAKLKKLRVK